MYQARQFAELAGVTVRALHHYDRLGLLKPKKRTQAGYRLYETHDLERLEQIVALKYVGLSLKEIRTALRRDTRSLLQALKKQRALLEERRMLLDKAIQAISEAESQMLVKGVARSDALRNIIGVIEMESNEDWMSKYATEEGRAKMEARKHLWSPELQERIKPAMERADLGRGASIERRSCQPTGQALAARWNGLVAEFTGRDKDIEQSVGNMWANRDKWPSDISQKAPVIKPEVWKFIAQANKTRHTEGAEL